MGHRARLKKVRRAVASLVNATEVGQRVGLVEQARAAGLLSRKLARKALENAGRPPPPRNTEEHAARTLEAPKGAE